MTRRFRGIECMVASAQSAELIAALHRLSFPDDTGERWRQSDLAGILAFTGTRSWIASRAGRPLGYLVARFILDEGEILSIGVRADTRRRGVGAALISACLKTASEHGLGKLHLEVRSDNYPAQKLYEKFNFRVIGQRMGYYQSHEGTMRDAITMMRDIDRMNRIDKIANVYT